MFFTQLRPNWVCCYYRTLTAPVELIKCFKSIKEHAFVASEYPVVITLEDHLTPNLQAKVAEVGYFVIIFVLSSYPHVLIIYVLLCCRFFLDDYYNIWRRTVYSSGI